MTILLCLIASFFIGAGIALWQLKLIPLSNFLVVTTCILLLLLIFLWGLS